jgi:prepilin-type processing-associated H-X9-DG protein
LACPSDPAYNPGTNFRLLAGKDGVPAGGVHPDCITTTSYVYTGYLQMTNAEMLSGLSAYTWTSTVMAISNPNDNGWRDAASDVASIGYTGSGNSGGGIINRLSAGVDRFLITDINTIFTGDEVGASVVPLMWDQISTLISEFSHVPAGQNILYLDGHVAFNRYDLTSTMFPSSAAYAAVNGGVTEKTYTNCIDLQ